MKKLLLFLMLVSLVCVMNAATLRYKGSGDWFNNITIDGTGWYDQVVGQGTAVVPGSADTVRANYGGNTVTLSGSATVGAFQAGVDETGTFRIQNNGFLTATGSSTLGQTGREGYGEFGKLIIDTGGTVQVNNTFKVGSAANSDGFAEISGLLSTTSHLWVGAGSGSTGTIVINSGGKISVGQMIGLGTGNASSASGGTATLTVNDGGWLALSNIHGLGTSVFPGSMFYLNGTGKITLPGDFTGVMNNLYAPSYITGNGILGNVVATFDSGANLTTVVAIPEPATMSLLALGAIALLRKKK